MKVAVAILATLAIAVAAQSTITVSEYSDRFGCQGTPTTYSIPSGKCEPGTHDISGLTLSCPTGPSSALCVTLDTWFRDNNCADNFHQTQHALCDQCQWGPETGYFKMTCDQIKGTVTSNRQCDKTCSKCNATSVLTIDTCTHFKEHNFTHSLKLVNISDCPPFITENVWYNGTNCTGGTNHQFDLEENVCYGGYKFSCSSSKRHSTKWHDRHRHDLLAQRALHNAIRRVHHP